MAVTNKEDLGISQRRTATQIKEVQVCWILMEWIGFIDHAGLQGRNWA
jgi:hypothetical protein